MTEWQHKGYLTKVARGTYIFSDFIRSEHDMWYIANRLYDPSYISLYSALWTYGYIPEAVFVTTSVTTRKTWRVERGRFRLDYRTVPPSFYFGYELVERNGRRVRFAHREKALLDLLYFERRFDDPLVQEGMRFNFTDMQREFDMDRLRTYMSFSTNKRFHRRVRIFLDLMKEHA
ncbi:MAG: hypothetical protein KF797_01455 [Flavobacteriales bacterium]|nr:hypothetical protein [Flavobacteriales bacterium]